MSEIEELRNDLKKVQEEVKLLRKACAASNEEIGQTLGKALGYPYFCHDQRNFPGTTEEDGVCIGDHVAESITDEAARRIQSLQQDYNDLVMAHEEALQALSDVLQAVPCISLDMGGKHSYSIRLTKIHEAMRKAQEVLSPSRKKFGNMILDNAKFHGVEESRERKRDLCELAHYIRTSSDERITELLEILRQPSLPNMTEIKNMLVSKDRRIKELESNKR